MAGQQHPKMCRIELLEKATATGVAIPGEVEEKENRHRAGEQRPKVAADTIKL